MAAAEVANRAMRQHETIFEAARTGDGKTVEALLKVRPEAYGAVDSQGWTPVLHAARGGHHAVIRILLAHGLNLELPLPGGYTALQAAARAGERLAAQCLISHGASLDPFSALALGAEEHVARLIELDPRVLDDVDGRGNNLLHWAVDVGHLDIAARLLEQRVPVDRPNLAGETPLRRLLCRPGPDIQGPLAELLLEHGARPTPVEAAALDLVEELALHLAADPAALDDEAYGAGPLHWAAYAGASRCVELLLTRGADVAGRDTDGATPLHYAVRGNQPETARQLLAAGADPATRDRQGVTPRDLAARNDELAGMLG